MLRSQTVNTIHDVHAQGKSVQEIAQELSISRTTVRKYLKHPEAVIPKSRPPRLSKLDPYKEQIKKWVMEDHCTNCEVLFERLQKLELYWRDQYPERTCPPPASCGGWARAGSAL